MATVAVGKEDENLTSTEKVNDEHKTSRTSQTLENDDLQTQSRFKASESENKIESALKYGSVNSMSINSGDSESETFDKTGTVNFRIVFILYF